jgi:hypothetical protein
LSRASVYASLKSYDIPTPDTNTDQQSSSSTRSSIPKSLQDASLISFYATMSKDYHRTVARLDCKNTAGRPLSTTDIAGRIQQRALTLVGGGYNSTPGVSSSNAAAATTNKNIAKKKRLVKQPVVMSNISGSQRKRKRRNLLQRINGIYSCDEHCTDNQMFQRHDIQFLMRLNAEWNVYIRSVLQLDTKSNDDDTAVELPILEKRVTTLQDNDMIEWIGSLVRIDQCLQIPKVKQRWIGRKGVLISSNAATWQIVLIARKNEGAKNTIKVQPLVHTQLEETDTMVNSWYRDVTIVIPKKGSTLAVQIPEMNGISYANSNASTQFISVILQQDKN